MAKDTTKLSHADYVSGVASLNIRRHLAAVSQPNATDTRAQRRTNMVTFRNAQAAAIRKAERIAALNAMKDTRQPIAAKFLAAPTLNKRDSVNTDGHTVTVIAASRRR
jgi:hypothetical protein